MAITPNAAEKKIIAAAKTGALADFSERKDKPKIRAEVLHRLITGLPQEARKSSDPVSPRGIRVKHAHIEGALDVSGWPVRADNAAIALPGLFFEDCAFDDVIDIRQSHFSALAFLGCTLVAVFGDEARIAGAAEFRGSLCSGAPHPLYGGKFALTLDNASIGSNLDLSTYYGQRFSAQGEVRFLGAEIGGVFAAIGAQLTHEGGDCLFFDGAKVKGSVFLNASGEHRFAANGCVRFPGAEIGGLVSAIGMNIQNPKGVALNAIGAVINDSVIIRKPRESDSNYDQLHENLKTVKTVIEGRIDFRNATIKGGWAVRDCKFSGPMDMGNAHIAVLMDNPETGWPQGAGQLNLDGCTYDALKISKDDEVEEIDLAKRRLKWLTRQYKNPEKPKKGAFRPQPFAQLAKVLQAQGHEAEADKIAIELRLLQLRASEDRWLMRQLQGFLNLTSSFGYSGIKAIASLLVWLILGTFAYSVHAFQGNFGPADQVTLGQHNTNPAVMVYVFTDKVPPHKIVRSCQGLVAPMYALDVMIPVIDLGQRRLCAFDPQGPSAPFWRLWHAFYAIMGAILSAITIVTFTGLMRKD